METSNATGFNWTSLDQESQSEQSILEGYIEVKAGAFLELYQIVGECGGRTVRTSLFEPKFVKVGFESDGPSAVPTSVEEGVVRNRDVLRK
jgi:hypothetical protein